MAGESARELARRQREKAARLEASAERYERGAEGEAATAAALEQLEARGWTLFHDVRWPGRQRANLDHVAVGPAGIFVIDSKLWAGDIRVVDGVLWQDRRRRENTVAAAGEAALAVTGLLQGFAATPVLCFVRSEPIVGWAREVMVCSTGTIADWLSSLPQVLGHESVERAATMLSGWLAPAMTLSRARPADSAPAVAFRPAAPPVWASRSTARRAMRGRSRQGGGRPNRRRAELRTPLQGFVLAVVVAVAAVALLPRIAARTPELLGLSPTHAELDHSVSLKGTSFRPPLRLTARAPVTVPSNRAEGTLGRGTRLVAVRLEVRNQGTRQWTSPRLRLALTDSTGEVLAPVPVRRLKRGPLLPAVVRLDAGGEVSGYVAFAVPRRARVADFSVGVGPSAYETVSWRATR